MKKLLFGLAAVPLIAGSALAANRLDDLQLDMVTAGQILGIDCPGCTLSSSNSTSLNGVTMTTGSTVIVGTNSGGSSGGSSSGSGGSSGGPSVPTGPSVVSSIPVPSNAAAIISGATTRTIVTP